MGDNNVTIHLGTVNEAFVKQTMFSTGNRSRPRSFAIGDFNNDDQMNIGVANSNTNNIGIFFGYRNIFCKSIDILNGSGFVSIFCSSFGDFNNNTRLDIAVANNGTDSLNIFLQTC
jgi:hypothetical protein